MAIEGKHENEALRYCPGTLGAGGAIWPKLSKALLIAAGGIFCYGSVLLRMDPVGFASWIREDGLVEWLTFFAFGGCATYCLLRCARLRPACRSGAGSSAPGSRRAFLLWLAIALLMLFGAMEEISWGQRIFEWESPRWFQVHNDQHETNIHNLIVGEVKLNKLVFGTGLAVILIVYLLLVPALYRNNTWFRRTADSFRLPIAQLYQVVLFLSVFLLTQLSLRADTKFDELQEFFGSFLFLAILTDPYRSTGTRGLDLREPRRGSSGNLAGLRRLFSRLPRLLRFGLVVLAIHVALFGLFRVVFWVMFQSMAPAAPSGDLLESFYLGSKFDLRLGLVLLAPVLLLSWIPGLRLDTSRVGRRVWLGYFVALTGMICLLYIVDLGHYDWLDSRITAAVLEHIHEPGIALEVLWESYPVLWGALGLGLFLVFYGFLLDRVAFRTLYVHGSPLSRWAKVGTVLAALALYGLGINGRVAGYPLRWSHAFFSPNPFTSALALNPVLYFFDSLGWQSTVGNYDVEAVRRRYDEVAEWLEVDAPDRERLSFSRRVQPRRMSESQPNFIVIHMESFGAAKLGAFGNALDPSPCFDALAREGLLFTSFFVPSTPTGRSVFSLLTGIPDVNPGDPASNNPFAVRQPTLVNAFEGYEKFYFYTGDLSWANIRGLLAHNIPDLQMFERHDFASPRNDGWGISDFHLFEEVHQVLRAKPKGPFLAFLQTSGNHPPWTIPKDKQGFELAKMDEEVLRKHNFRWLKEYNAIRFLDYSLGHFVALCRREPFFANTLFLIYGDHGARGTGSHPLQPTGLNTYHVPLLVYGPGLIPEGRVIDTMSSSVDVLPTMAALAGLSCWNQTMGRDLLEPRPSDREFAFLRVGLVEREFFLSVAENRLYRYRGSTPANDVTAEHPDEVERMRRRWSALYETARYMLHGGAKQEAEASRGAEQRN